MSLAAVSIISDISEQSTVCRNVVTYLNAIWQKYFADVPCVNNVEISYCRPWKSRLGVIRLSLDNRTSFIGLNALLQHPTVPECVLIATISHELTHYAHGFGSPMPRLYEHPHANNIVKNELEKRGLGEILSHCDEWIDSQWFTFYDMQREAGWADLPGIYRPFRSRKRSLV